MRTKFWLPAATALVVLSLGALAHVQWGWINRLSRGQEEHDRRVLDIAARQFAEEFNRDVASIVSGMERHQAPEAMFRNARDPRLIAGVYIVHEQQLEQVTADGSHHFVDWPPALAPVRARIEGHDLRGRSPIEPTIPAIVLPLGTPRMPFIPHEEPPPAESRPAIIIVMLDRAYMTQHRFPELARGLGEEFDVAVSDEGGVIYRSSRAWNGMGADATAPLLHESGWQVRMRYHWGSIPELAAYTRRRNLLMIGHVMAVLVISLAIMAIIAQRAEWLRERQLEFVAGMTHELNTPIAALHSAGENLADGLVHDDAQVARYGAVVTREARRLGDLVAQVLDYSGLQKGPKIARAPVDIASVIANAIDATRWLAEDQRVEVQPSIAGDLPPVAGDAEALTRAVQNLIANAVRHGGEGRWVGVSASHRDGKVAITVEDRGPGIAARDARHLFEPFYRGRNATARGTGLGLTIVSQIAKAHGGTIAFDRHRERGAAFTLTIPAVRRG